jgi:hypothetical protein
MTNDLPGTPEGDELPGTGFETGVEDEAQEGAPSGEEDSLLPSEVPPALQPQLRAIEKQMKAVLTRKTQELANERKSLGESAYKASILDGLMSDPEIVQILTEKTSQRAGKGSRAQAEADDLDPVTALRQEMQRMIAPVAGELRRLQAERERDKLFSTQPEAETLRESLVEVLQGNPHLTLEQAFRVARDMKREQTERKTKVQKTVEGNRTAVESPGGTRREVDVSQNGKLRSFAESAESALKAYGFEG